MPPAPRPAPSDPPGRDRQAGPGQALRTLRERQRRRLDRQLLALADGSPALRGFVTAIRGRPGALIRLPAGVLLVAGGFLAVLPVFGLWMIPLGLLVLAIDLPLLRPPVSALIIRLRRRWALWRRGTRPRS